MCGDHLEQLPYEKMVMGSPPHVRGPLAFKEGPFGPLGITPACAGTTLINPFRIATLTFLNPGFQ